MTTPTTLPMDDAQTEVFEYLAVSILEALPEEKLGALDEALSEGGDALEAFLASHVTHFDDVLSDALVRLRIIVGESAL